MPRPVTVAAWLTCDERYGAYVFGPFKTLTAAASSLGLLAHAIECELSNRGFVDPARIEYEWLGRLVDTSEARVRSLVGIVA